jgi:putative phosphoribosyl transferase
MIFRDRQHAGRLLGERLMRFRGRSDVLILGLARGGMPVARTVAEQLGVPAEIFIVRKLGVPWQPELAMGAVAESLVEEAAEPVYDPQVLRHCNLSQQQIDAMVERERHEITRRIQLYRDGRKLPDLGGKTVIVIDDGLATGSTMLAAVKSLRVAKPARIVVAVPVAPPATCDHLAEEVDKVVCLQAPEPFMAVGAWYEDFPQVSDQEARTAAQNPTGM